MPGLLHKPISQHVLRTLGHANNMKNNYYNKINNTRGGKLVQ